MLKLPRERGKGSQPACLHCLHCLPAAPHTPPPPPLCKGAAFAQCKGAAFAHRSAFVGPTDDTRDEDPSRPLNLDRSFSIQSFFFSQSGVHSVGPFLCGERSWVVPCRDVRPTPPVFSHTARPRSGPPARPLPGGTCVPGVGRGAMPRPARGGGRGAAPWKEGGVRGSPWERPGDGVDARPGDVRPRSLGQAMPPCRRRRCF